MPSKIYEKFFGEHKKDAFNTKEHNPNLNDKNTPQIGL